MESDNHISETNMRVNLACKSCCEKIVSALEKESGVISASADLQKGEVRVSHTGREREEIKDKIRGLGYKVDGIGPGNRKGGTIMEGIAYGLLPHTGCIAFIAGSILGVTLLMEFFKPLLMNPYFFHILMAISVGFATLSSALYLRRNGLLSLDGAKVKWKYLTAMYGSTLGINLLLFMFIFPMLANVSAGEIQTAAAFGAGGVAPSLAEQLQLPYVRLKVDIPCPGHAPLISEELKRLPGVSSIRFDFPNIFTVSYNPSEATVDQIASIGIFSTYRATILETGGSTVQAAGAEGSGNGQGSASALAAVSSPAPDNGQAGSCGGCGSSEGSCGGSGAQAGAAGAGGCGCGYR